MGEKERKGGDMYVLYVLYGEDGGRDGWMEYKI